MPTSERARLARRARAKARREEQEENYPNEDYWKVPQHHLPKFIQEVGEKYGWNPLWKQCYKNAFILGWMLDNEGYDVQYCEAMCASEGAGGFPYSHAWLRVDGIDYNLTSDDGKPPHIYTNYPMAIMPIREMRPSGADVYGDTPYLGMSIAHSEYSEHPRVKPYVSPNVSPEMLTEHTTSSVLL